MGPREEEKRFQKCFRERSWQSGDSFIAAHAHFFLVEYSIDLFFYSGLQ